MWRNVSSHKTRPARKLTRPRLQAIALLRYCAFVVTPPRPACRRPAYSGEADHSFRSKPIRCSGSIRSPTSAHGSGYLSAYLSV